MNTTVKKIAKTLAAGVMAAGILAGCAPSAGTTVATIGNEKLTYGVANFYVRYNQSMYESYYTNSGATSMADVWSGPSSVEGMTVEESMKSTLKDELEEMVVLHQNMDQYKVSLSDADKAMISAAADNFIASNSQETLDVMTATKENIEQYLEYYLVQDRMFDPMTADVDTNVTDEEALQKSITYVSLSYGTTMQNVGGGTDDEAMAEIMDSLADSSKDASLQAAGDFVEEAKTTDDLEALAEQYSGTVSTMTIGADDTYPSEEFVQAAFALKEGEWTEPIVIEDIEQIYVARMDNEFDKEATESEKDTIVNQRKNDLYEERLTAMKEAMDIKWNEGTWNKISFIKTGVSMIIPEDVQEAAEAADAAAAEQAATTLSTDPAEEIADGDKVNIDYVGSIDGVEFEGGNTQGMGADLTIGSHSYIDDFEEQLIGHHPGDEVTVTVTFPEDYGKTELNGKEAEFAVTINGVYR